MWKILIKLSLFFIFIGIMGMILINDLMVRLILLDLNMFFFNLVLLSYIIDKQEELLKPKVKTKKVCN
jgi:multisubunit Na+/H+ antiporter MnhG subunit